MADTTALEFATAAFERLEGCQKACIDRIDASINAEWEKFAATMQGLEERRARAVEENDEKELDLVADTVRDSMRRATEIIACMEMQKDGVKAMSLVVRDMLQSLPIRDDSDADGSTGSGDTGQGVLQMDTLYETFMALLARAVDDAGSASRLAKATGIRQTTISRWLARTRMPTFDSVQPVLDHLGVVARLAPKDKE